MHLVGEGEATHTGLDAEDVVVGGEHVESGVGAILGNNLDLSVVDTREVASASGLVLLGLEGEGVGVDTRGGVARVMAVGLDLVEVLTGLGLEAVLAVEDELEGIKGTSREGGGGGTVLDVLSSGDTGGGLVATDELRNTSGSTKGGNVDSVGRDETVGDGVSIKDDGTDNIGVGGEVPKLGVGRVGTGEAPDELLDGVVVGKADLLGTTGGDGVGTSVLELFNEVLVTLLGEAAALLGVEVDVVTPDLEDGGVEVVGELGGEVKVKTDLVVLEGDEGEVKSGVAVEEEDEGEHELGGTTDGISGHLSPVGLLGLVEAGLRVESPPALVVLVDALTTNGKLDGSDGALGGPATRDVSLTGTGRKSGGTLELDVHVTNEITVAGDGDGDATRVGNGTVDGLLDVLHSEVSVALVDGLEEGNLGVTGQVDVLGTVGNKLH